MRFLSFVMIGLLLAVANGSAHASRQYALLIGVSVYDNLPPYQYLRGPGNDVKLLREILLDRGFSNKHMKVLASDVKDANKPTRDAVLGALTEIGDNLEEGDFVFLYFAGHGSQQPVPPGVHESDGLDEVFLPADVGKWNAETKQIEKSISDNEIGQHIRVMRNRGAFVWAVFDTCHSGTMTRASPVAGERQRNVDAVSSLGVPPTITGEFSATMPGDVVEVPEPLNPNAGGYVAFYASQSLETTPELNLPYGSDASQPHGLFTYNLATVLTQYPHVTYRQAAYQVLRNYTIMNRFRPTPVFEGSNLDSPLFGTQTRKKLAQWPLSRTGSTITLSAGRLHLLTEGSELAILPGPASELSNALGYARVSKAGLTSSELIPVKGSAARPVDIEDIPEKAYARLVKPGIEFSLRVARPAEPENSAVAKALESLADSENAGTHLKIVTTDASADVYLAVYENRLLLLPASDQDAGTWQGPQIALNQTAEAIKEDLSLALSRVGKVLNLMRLSDYMPADNLPVHLDATVRRAGAKRPLESHSVALLQHGDRMEFIIANASYKPVDVTVFFIDSAYRMHAVYPRELGELNRIEPRGREVIRGVVDSSATAGRESLVMVAVAAEPNQPANDFSFLADDLIAVESTLRGGRSALDQLFRQVAFAGAETRGRTKTTSDDLQNSTMNILTWDTAGPGDNNEN